MSLLAENEVCRRSGIEKWLCSSQSKLQVQNDVEIFEWNQRHCKVKNVYNWKRLQDVFCCCELATEMICTHCASLIGGPSFYVQPSI